MADTLNLGLNVDSAPIVALRKRLLEVKTALQDATDPKLINDLVKQTKELTQTFDTLNKSIEDTNEDVELLANSIGGLEQKQASLREELSKLEIGSEAYKQLNTQLIQTSIQLKNIELANEALDNEQLAGELKSVAGGFGDIAGGLALIGVSSGTVEQIAQTFAKVEGITKAVTGGIEAYSSGMKVLNALSTKGATIQSVLATVTGTKAAAEVVDTVALEGQAVATAEATVASNALNASLLLNPVFLLVAAIGALVGALVYFSSETEVAEQNNDALNETLEELQGNLDRQNEKNIRHAQNKVDALRAAGAAEEEIHQAELDLLYEEERARKRNVSLAKIAIEEKHKNYVQALKEGNEELAKQIKDEIKQERDKYKNLLNLAGQYEIDVKNSNTQFTREQKEEADEDAKKAAEERQRKNKEAAQRQKEYNSNRLSAQREQEDLELSLLVDGQDKQLKANEIKYKRLIEDTKNNEKLTGEAIRDANNVIIGYTGEKGKRLIALEKARVDDTAEINSNAFKKEQETEKTNNELRVKNQKAFNQILYDAQTPDDQKVIDKIKSDAAEKIRILKESATDEQKLNGELNAAIKVVQDKADADELKAIADQEKAKTDAKNKSKIDELSKDTSLKGVKALNDEMMRQELENTNLTEEEKTKIKDKYRKLNQDADIAAAQAALQAVSDGLNAIQGVSDSLFAVRSQKAEQETKAANDRVSQAEAELEAAEGASEGEKQRLRENVEEAKRAAEAKAKAEERLAKKQFEINKKLQIAQAVVQGIQAVLAAYSSGSAIPVVGAVTGPLFAGLAAITVAANVSKIKNSKFESTSATPDAGGGGSATPSLGAADLAPSSQNLNNATGQKSVEANQTQNINVTIGVDEISDKQNTVNNILESGKL